MSTQHHRLRILGAEALGDLGPQHTGSTHLGNFHEVVHTDGPEETQARSKGIDVDAGVNTRAQIVHTVSQSVSQLNVGSGTGFLHVITRNGDGVELRHLLRSELEDVGNNLHGEGRRINIGVTHHELLQNVVLNGSGHHVEGGSLLQTGHDVEGHDGKHGTIHCHRHRHILQGNAREQYLHVLNRTDRHTGLTHVTNHAFVIGVVATVSWQVESHRQTLLTTGQIAAIESVALFSR